MRAIQPLDSLGISYDGNFTPSLTLQLVIMLNTFKEKAIGTNCTIILSIWAVYTCLCRLHQASRGGGQRWRAAKGL